MSKRSNQKRRRNRKRNKAYTSFAFTPKMKNAKRGKNIIATYAMSIKFWILSIYRQNQLEKLYKHILIT